MAKSNIKADEISFTIVMDVKGVQSELYSLSSSSQDLQQKNKDLQAELKKTEKQMAESEKAMRRMEAAGKDNSVEYDRAKTAYDQAAAENKQFTAEINANTKAIEANNAKAKELISTLKIEDMTMDQLKQRASQLQKELNSTSKSANPTAYNSLQKELTQVNGRMGELKGTSSGVGGSFGSLASAGTKLFAYLGIGIGVFEGLKGIMASTQQTGDSLENEIAGLQGAFNYFQRSLATMDFSNFFHNLKEAYNAAKEVNAMLDEMFERRNSFSITSTRERAELEDMKTQLRDVNLPLEQRKKLAEEIIQRTEALANKEIEIEKQEQEAYRKKIKSQTQMTDAQIDYYIVNYEGHRNEILMMTELQALEDKRKQFKTSLSQADAIYNAQAIAGINEQIAAQKNLIQSTVSNYQLLYDSVKNYGKTDDTIVKNFVESTNKVAQIEITTERELRRVKSTEFQLDKKQNDGQNKVFQKQKEEFGLLEESIETKHQERLTEIKKKYASGEIKTEADYNQQLFAENQAYYTIQDNALTEHLDKLKQSKVKNADLESEINKKIASLQTKQLDEEIKFRAQLERIILDADPVAKENKEYNERLAASGLFGIDREKLTREQLQALEILEKQHQDNLTDIRRNAENKQKAQAKEDFEKDFKSKKEEMQAELAKEEQSYTLNAGTGALTGNAAFETEVSLQQKRIALIQAEIDARKAAGLEYSQLLQKQQSEELAMTDIYVKEYQRRTQQFNQYAESLGSAVGNVLTGQENVLKAFGNVVLDMLFDTLSSIINAKIAEATAVAIAEQAKAAAISAAQPDSVVTFGASAIARTAIIGGIIMAALTAAKSTLKGLLNKGKSGSSDTSATSSTTYKRVVKQQAGGKYDVIGEQDGRTYKDVPYAGPAKTGMVYTPTLVGERGAELVISAPDMKSLQKHINYPLVVQALKDVRTGTVPQRAAGKYDNVNMPATGSISSPDNGQLNDTLQSVQSVLQDLRKFGVSMDFQNFENSRQRMDTIKNLASRNGNTSSKR